MSAKELCYEWYILNFPGFSIEMHPQYSLVLIALVTNTEWM